MKAVRKVGLLRKGAGLVMRVRVMDWFCRAVNAL